MSCRSCSVGNPSIFIQEKHKKEQKLLLNHKIHLFFFQIDFLISCLIRHCLKKEVSSETVANLCCLRFFFETCFAFVFAVLSHECTLPRRRSFSTSNFQMDPVIAEKRSNEIWQRIQENTTIPVSLEKHLQQNISK